MIDSIREKTVAYIADWDAKYRRVPEGDVINLGPDNSSFDIADELRTKLGFKASGRYELVCAMLPDLGDVVDLGDDYTDEEYDEYDELFFEILKEIGRDDYLWVIPEDDELYDSECVGIHLQAD